MGPGGGHFASETDIWPKKNVCFRLPDPIYFFEADPKGFFCVLTEVTLNRKTPGIVLGFSYIFILPPQHY